MRIRTFSIAPCLPEIPPPGKPSANQTLVFAFGDASMERASPHIASLVEAYPGAHILGCSTAGEIVGDSVVDGTLSGAVVEFESTTLRSATAAVGSVAGSFRAGRKIALQLAVPGLRGVFVLSDGLSVNGSELTRGLNSGLPDGVVVTGGLAADGNRFQATWVIADGRAMRGAVAAVGFYGESIEIGHGSRGGWDIFGPERLITRSRANVLFELDGRPALSLYKEYLGELASGLPATALRFPLAVRESASAERQVVRAVLAVDESRQSLTFAGDVPEGSKAQLMRGNFDRLIDGASIAAAHAVPEAGPAVLSIAISCVGRRLILGERTEEELEATAGRLPPGSEQIGFYSYGEISPFLVGRCELHNQTMTVTTLREREA